MIMPMTIMMALFNSSPPSTHAFHSFDSGTPGKAAASAGFVHPPPSFPNLGTAVVVSDAVFTRDSFQLSIFRLFLCYQITPLEQVPLGLAAQYSYNPGM